MYATNLTFIDVVSVTDGKLLSSKNFYKQRVYQVPNVQGRTQKMNVIPTSEIPE